MFDLTADPARIALAFEDDEPGYTMAPLQPNSRTGS